MGITKSCQKPETADRKENPRDGNEVSGPKFQQIEETNIFNMPQSPVLKSATVKQQQMTRSNLIPGEADPCKFTLILDLDETLVHTEFDFTNYADTKLRLPLTRETAVFQTDFSKDYIEAYVSVRPGAAQMIEDLSKYYEIAIWTASPEEYALPIINFLGVRDHLAAVLTKQHCKISPDGTFMFKDLCDLGRNVERVIIVDDTQKCFSKHPDRGVWMRPYKGRPDQCLPALGRYLTSFARNGFKSEELVHAWEKEL